MTTAAVTLLILTLALPQLMYGITTIHHDKPQPQMMTMKEAKPVPSERQKRLLPYVNYYLNRGPPKLERPEKFTPFLDSNALPGPFIPIATPRPVDHSPNYATIYDTLSRLKQSQQNAVYRKPIVEYIPQQYYDRNLPQSKTIIETYTPTNIDVSDQKYEPAKPEPPSNPYILERPIYYYQPQEQTAKPYFVRYETEKPIVYEVATPKPQINAIVDDSYVAQKYVSPVQFVTQPPNVETDNTNILSKILKQLQSSNTLPQTLTTENIDNSIRTLVKILNNLRKQQKLKSKPIVVADENPEEITETSLEFDEEDKPQQYAPGTVTQVFPANTVDGGTPGRPGIDYPALSSIPQTSFNCKTQRYKGFFGDPHTNCQVWHYCDLNGGQASFLCPNGTIFSQVALTCDWWYNVKCDSTTQLYVLNERLYKYILPYSPKFPEDYSGPLVDKYLALKFKEMEEKMKKGRKKEDKEEKSEEDKDDSDQLQDIQNARRASIEET